MSRTEYIEREAAMQAVCKGCNIEFSDEPCEPSDCYIKNKLLRVPAADVSPVVHGRWERCSHSRYCGLDDYGDPIFRDGVIYYCSECRRKTVIKENYCPNCGAKMDEKEEDNEQINRERQTRALETEKLNWDDIRPGERIAKDVWVILYGALFKLLKYEDTGLDPDQIREMDELYLDKCREVNDLKEKVKSANAGWIPFEQRRTDALERMETGSDYILTGRLPDDGQEILVSDGDGVWSDIFLDDGCEGYLDSGIDIDIIGDSLAWMPLPEPYKPAHREDADNTAVDHADQDTIAPAT